MDDKRIALVANRFDDSLAVVDLNASSLMHTLSLGPTPTPTPSERGEQLFYDASLALHGWFSCHSCHSDGHSCGLSNDNFGDDTIGAPKRIPSLLGTGDTAPWGWNGRQANLASQIEKSMRLTMHADEMGPIAETDVQALESYLRSLAPPPSVAAARGGAHDRRSPPRERRL